MFLHQKTFSSKISADFLKYPGITTFDAITNFVFYNLDVVAFRA